MSAVSFETMADVLEQLGDISPRRVRLRPVPGKATERDLIRLLDHTDRLYELVDGILVEKIMASLESSLACDLIGFLQSFLADHALGFLMGPDGPARLMPGLVRMPDISFISWKQLPTRERPMEAIAGLAPALAVEVLSPGNTPGEMTRKLKEYFLAGVRVVWFVDPRARTVQVFTAPDRAVTLTEKDTLDGGEVLPGFALSVKRIFAGLPPRKRGRGKGKGT
jgi:Uma2 family endonuclease